jgi:proteic killer suppression protein
MAVWGPWRQIAEVENTTAAKVTLPGRRGGRDADSAISSRERVSYYERCMIRSCRDKDAQRLLERKFSRRLQAIENSARVRLELLDAVTSLRDLDLPGFRLEALKGDRKGEYSIRINDQYRICFRWLDGDAHDVEIVDYH